MIIRFAVPLMIVAAFIISGCGTIATPEWQRPTLTPTLESVEQSSLITPVRLRPMATPAPATSTVTPMLTATVLVGTATIIPSLTPTPIPPIGSSQSTDGRLEAISQADPTNGQTLFNTFQPAASFACTTCHHTDREDRLIGPGLLNVSIRAESRMANQSAVDYIYTSITDPSAFVVADFPDGLMPQNWTEIYSDDDINDIIAYLFTLRDD